MRSLFFTGARAFFSSAVSRKVSFFLPAGAILIVGSLIAVAATIWHLRSDALAGRVIAVTAQVHDAVTQGEHLHVPHLADAPDGELYFPYIVCGQLYAFHRSLSVGNTPDQPSNSGTVSRVVSGVTIHSL